MRLDYYQWENFYETSPYYSYIIARSDKLEFGCSEEKIEIISL